MRCITCARCGYARAAAYGKVCHMFRSQQCLSTCSLSSVYYKLSWMLPRETAGSPRKSLKKHTIACSSIIHRALVRLDLSDSCVSVRHCVCVCCVCESECVCRSLCGGECVCARARRSRYTTIYRDKNKTRTREQVLYVWPRTKPACL